MIREHTDWQARAALCTLGSYINMKDAGPQLWYYAVGSLAAPLASKWQAGRAWGQQAGHGKPLVTATVGCDKGLADPPWTHRVRHGAHGLAGNQAR